MKEKIESLLAGISAPDGDGDLISEKIAETTCDDNGAKVVLYFPYPAQSVFADMQKKVTECLAAADIQAQVRCENRIYPRVVQGGVRRLPEVKNIIAVASGKGGVGKSATAVNLALALAAEGARVGMLDADVYGPSLPTMLGVHRRPQGVDGGIAPLTAFGMQVMSIGFMVEDDQPAIWRGPIASRALTQLLEDTKWDGLDYLVLDMPPGTGDIQLTAAQKMPITGAVIITTPQDLALSDAQRGIVMFNKTAVPVLGLVENMSVYICPQCGHEAHIFGGGGAHRLAEKYQSEVLGEVPLDESIRSDADAGTPTMVSSPDGEIAARYRQIARRAAARLAQKPRDRSGGIPQIVAEK